MSPTFRPEDKFRLKKAITDTIENFCKANLPNVKYKVFGTIGIESEDDDSAIMHFSKELAAQRQLPLLTRIINRAKRNLSESSSSSDPGRRSRTSCIAECDSNRSVNGSDALSSENGDEDYDQVREVRRGSDSHDNSEAELGAEQAESPVSIFNCNHCNFASSTAYEHYRHLRLHSAFTDTRRGYACLQCNATFLDELSLRLHIRLHEERPQIPSNYGSYAAYRDASTGSELRPDIPPSADRSFIPLVRRIRRPFRFINLVSEPEVQITAYYAAPSQSSTQTPRNEQRDDDSKDLSIEEINRQLKRRLSSSIKEFIEEKLTQSKYTVIAKIRIEGQQCLNVEFDKSSIESSKNCEQTPQSNSVESKQKANEHNQPARVKTALKPSDKEIDKRNKGENISREAYKVPTEEPKSTVLRSRSNKNKSVDAERCQMTSTRKRSNQPVIELRKSTLLKRIQCENRIVKGVDAKFTKSKRQKGDGKSKRNDNAAITPENLKFKLEQPLTSTPTSNEQNVVVTKSSNFSFADQVPEGENINRSLETVEKDSKIINNVDAEKNTDTETKHLNVDNDNLGKLCKRKRKVIRFYSYSRESKTTGKLKDQLTTCEDDKINNENSKETPKKDNRKLNSSNLKNNEVIHQLENDKSGQTIDTIQSINVQEKPLQDCYDDRKLEKVDEHSSNSSKKSTTDLNIEENKDNKSEILLPIKANDNSKNKNVGKIIHTNKSNNRKKSAIDKPIQQDVASIKVKDNAITVNNNSKAANKNAVDNHKSENIAYDKDQQVVGREDSKVMEKTVTKTNKDRQLNRDAAAVEEDAMVVVKNNSKTISKTKCNDNKESQIFDKDKKNKADRDFQDIEAADKEENIVIVRRKKASGKDASKNINENDKKSKVIDDNEKKKTTDKDNENEKVKTKNTINGSASILREILKTVHKNTNGNSKHSERKMEKRVDNDKDTIAVEVKDNNTKDTNKKTKDNSDHKEKRKVVRDSEKVSDIAVVEDIDKTIVANDDSNDSKQKRVDKENQQVKLTVANGSSVKAAELEDSVVIINDPPDEDLGESLIGKFNILPEIETTKVPKLPEGGFQPKRRLYTCCCGGKFYGEELYTYHMANCVYRIVENLKTRSLMCKCIMQENQIEHSNVDDIFLEGKGSEKRKKKGRYRQTERAREREADGERGERQRVPALDPRERNRLNVVLSEVVEMFVKDHVEDQHFKMFGTIGIELDNKDAVVFHFERDILNASRKKAGSAPYGLDIKQERDLATQSNAVRAAVKVEKPKVKKPENDIIEERPYAEFDELPSLREEHTINEEKATPKKKIFSCNMCSQVFDTKVELHNHEKLHSESAESATTDDGNDIVNPTSTVDNSASATAASVNPAISDSAIAEAASIAVRESKGSGSKKHACSYCSKAFTTAYNLTNHIRTHTGM
ncbi:DgyrCDS14313 [Dimorphilus gyrociliatus]|uniref:DgyrCDS14313 n=1 Tax=Dimorphilus gyrociliatus TaxID=2664684 RepID=A0A7I8WDK1_9ANNE|nr:DgyrCDS14313 [Dimorphilus gyrociliatus]